MKKIQIALISIILFVVLSLGLGLVMQSFVQTKAKAATTDFTQFTEEEQNTLNTKMTEDWYYSGTYVNISGRISENMIEINSDRHYILTGDVILEGHFTKLNQGYCTNIVLNGYSISGAFTINMNSSARFMLYDRVAQATNAGTYNPSPTKYYSYNSATGSYSTYSTTKPSVGEDVTNLPTHKTGTYISITGSAVSPNSLSSVSKPVFIANSGTMRFYGVNFVGTVTGDMFTFQNAVNAGLYQCNIIGNVFKTGVWVSNYGGLPTVKIEGCKIYGNQTTLTEWVLSDTLGVTKQRDILIEQTAAKNVSAYKNDIGALVDYGLSRKGVYLKGVDFKQRFDNFSVGSFEKNIASLNNIEGTIELVSSTNLTYNGNSPNLNIILHGGSTPTGNSTTEGTKGSNTLTILNNATVKSVSTRYSNPGLIINKGRINSLSSTGTVEVSGPPNGYMNTFINENDKVENLVVNGAVWHKGFVTNLTLKEGARFILQGNAVVQNLTWESGTLEQRTSHAVLPSTTLTIPKEGTYHVADNATLPTNTNFVVNGQLNIAGNAVLDKVTTNNGSTISVVGAGNVELPAGKIVQNFAVTDSATNVSIAATVTQLSVSAASANVVLEKQATVDVLNTTEGQTQILGTVKKLINNDAAITTANGTVQALEFLGGTIHVLKTDGLPNNTTITIPTNGKLSIAEKLTFTNTIINNGTLILSGHVTNFSGSGIVEVTKSATLEVPVGKKIENIRNYGQVVVKGEAENIICEDGTVLIEKHARVSTLTNNAGTVTVLGRAARIVNGSVARENRASANLTIGQEAVVNTLENNAIATTNNTIETVSNTGELIQNDISVYTNLNNTGKATVRGTSEKVVSSTNSDLRIEQNAKITNLHVVAGVTTVVSANANIVDDIRVEEFAVLNILEGVNLQNFIYNYGTVNVFGIANNIISTGLLNITTTGSVSLQGGLSVEKIVNEGNLEVAVGAKVNNITNRGTVLIDIGANVSYVLSEAGTTTIADNATVDNLVITGGHVTVRGGATTKQADLQSGTLEILVDANVNKILRGNGTLVDHNDQLAFILLLVFSIGGGALFIGAIVVLIILLVKRKNKKTLQGAFNRVQDIAAAERIRQMQERVNGTQQPKE